MKLYNVPPDSPTALVVVDLEQECAERGLTLSRWQANGLGHNTIITWAAHPGPRPGFSKDLPGEALIVRLNHREGKTTTCQAYRRLSWLLSAVRTQ